MLVCFCSLGAGIPGSAVPDGALNPLFGRGVEYPDVSTAVGPPKLFLALAVGIGGKEDDGGPRDGLDDLGSEVAIVCVYVVQQVLLAVVLAIDDLHAVCSDS